MRAKQPPPTSFEVDWLEQITLQIGAVLIAPQEDADQTESTVEHMFAKAFHTQFPDGNFFSQRSPLHTKRDSTLEVIFCPLGGDGEGTIPDSTATTAVATLRGGDVLHAVIRAHFKSPPETYRAEHSAGAFLNSEQIHVSQEALSIAVAGASPQLSSKLSEASYSPLSTQNVSLACAKLAQGSLSAVLYPRAGLYAAAAAALLVTEAGGVAMDLNGEKLNFGGSEISGFIMANNDKTANDLLAIFNQHRQ